MRFRSKHFIYLILGWMSCSTLAQAEKVLPVSEIKTPFYQLTLPTETVSITTEVEERTPWGRANVKVYSVTDYDGSVYRFSAFDFLSKQKLDPRKLKQVRSSFLQQRKCVAKDVAANLWLDDKGQAWPQTLFEGYCAAPERFMVLTAMADGRLYRLQIISKRPALDDASSQSLKQLMKWLAEHSHLGSE